MRKPVIIHDDDRVVMTAGEARAAFTRRGDRWIHTIGRAAEGAIELAASVESDPDRDPAGSIVSPVYQELHRHEIEGESRLCLLLTGCFLDHHFSAAASLTSAGVIEIDVADRCRGLVQSLAATYTVALDSSRLVDADSMRIVWAGGALGDYRLELEAEPPCTLALAEAGRRATRAQINAAIDPSSFTRRLRYRWRWASDRGGTV